MIGHIGCLQRQLHRLCGHSVELVRVQTLLSGRQRCVQMPPRLEECAGDDARPCFLGAPQTGAEQHEDHKHAYGTIACEVEEGSAGETPLGGTLCRRRHLGAAFAKQHVDVMMHITVKD